jgi:ribosomal protein S18 acetylase RimI-like enzyme
MLNLIICFKNRIVSFCKGMSMRIKYQKKTALIGALLLGVCVGMYYYMAIPKIYIDEFNVQCDMQQMLHIFKNNWHALVEGNDFSPTFMMKKRAPGSDPRYFGKLKIKVMRDNEQLAGFVSYYMKDKCEGVIHLLAVDQQFRGKRYGQKLMKHAIDDLASMGIQHVGLWVLINNIHANKLYKDLGFIEKYYDDKKENVYLYYVIK